MINKQFKIKFGFETVTSFGLRGCSHGMYSGGFNHYAYGLYPFISFHYLKTWGDFNDMEL